MLGEGYTPDDEEDSAVAEVSNVYVYQARYRIPVSRATAGNLVLIEGIDATITKTATVVSEHLEQEMHIFRWGGCLCYACCTPVGVLVWRSVLRFADVASVQLCTESEHLGWRRYRPLARAWQ